MACVQSSLTTHNFNADCTSDVAWREAGGTTAAWLINRAGAVLQAGSYGVVPTTWAIVGQRDFNGDGTYDLLWRDGSTGTVALWLLNGLQVVVVQTVSLGAVPSNWAIFGTGQFHVSPLDGSPTFSGVTAAPVQWRSGALTSSPGE